MSNNNQSLIDGLRQAADFLEAHPDVNKMQLAWMYATVYTKEELKEAARTLGSFEKKMDNLYYKIVKSFGPLLLEISIPRERVCKKIVTWDCPDESILKLFESVEAE